MNCLEFESQLEGLARGALTDARTRSAAEAHAGSCGLCAARLADERALSTGLRALASGMKRAEASARVEAALLASLRARAASDAAAADSKALGAPSNVLPLSAQTNARPWSWAKTFAVASLAAAASLTFFILVRQGASPNRSNAPREVAAAGPQQRMIEPPPGDDGSGLPPQSQAAALKQPGVEEGTAPSPEPNAGRSNTPRTFTPRARIVNASDTSVGRGASARPASETSAQEVATEFIPLMQAGPYAQAEDGHLVRVELPRSALASFGLPVNAEAANGRVKADVLLGQDGIARAIRFIR